MSNPLPTTTEELLAELAALGSFTIGERTPRDWSAIEAALGIRLPSQYKEYAEHFPVGQFRHLQVWHPESSESPPWPKPWGLVESVRELSRMMGPWVSNARYLVYPEPGGLIPWADYEGDYFLCWLPNDENPDQWPVVAFNSTTADEDRNSEIVDGSTLQSLIRVIRGDAGRRIFPGQFYEFPVNFVRALPENERSFSTPDQPK